MSDGAPDWTAYTFRLNPAKMERVRELGEEHHRSLVGELRQIIDEYVDAHRPEDRS